MAAQSIGGLVSKRLASGLVTLFLVSVLVFVGTEILPGDVAQAVLGQQATPEAIQAIRDELAAKGHDIVKPKKPVGGSQAIWIDPETGIRTGGSDPRKDGCAIGY